MSKVCAFWYGPGSFIKSGKDIPQSRVKTAVMEASKPTACKFDHVELYVRKLQPISFYQRLQKASEELSTFSGFVADERSTYNDKFSKIPELRSKWLSIIPKFDLEDVDPESYSPQNQDLIEQLIVGLGWRVVAEQSAKDTRSILIKPKQGNGATFIISAPTQEINPDSIVSNFVNKAKISEYFANQSNRQGVSVLSFDVSDSQNSGEDFGKNLNIVFENYKKLHPELLLSSSINTQSFGTGEKMCFFEAFAYSNADDKSKPDKGTKLRFMERTSSAFVQGDEVLLPGFLHVAHEFDSSAMDLIFDHWVSNVANRERFLEVLENVLGFKSKVDFNAGVVAAGKAKIESTVTGNDLEVGAEVEDGTNPQVYLPINNALSEYGHVHLFLKEIGQGVQHIASKVSNLVNLMERINCYRMITGRGFRSLRIPRVYYGALDSKRHLQKVFKKYMESDEKQLMKSSDDFFNFLVDRNVISTTGIVDLQSSKESLMKIISEFNFVISGDKSANLTEELVETVLLARYNNIFGIAGDEFDEGTYLSIVRNQILLDKQGYDFLMQIFTANILQEKVGDEAPFLEFIERRCQKFEICNDSDECKRSKVEKKPRPGCGGFGIRNFLTLFLSIEVSKAMDELQALTEESAKRENEAKESNLEKEERMKLCRSKIELYTNQLDESNPILNDISDIMTEEAEVLEKIKALKKDNNEADGEALKALEERSEQLSVQKASENEKLQNLSARFVGLFDDLE